MDPIYWVIIIATAVVGGLAVFVIYWKGEQRGRRDKDGS